MSEVGEVFVRVRPNTAGFKEEASGPVAAAGTSLAKTFLAAFAIGGIAESIKGAVSAATEHQAAFAVLSQTTKDAGASTTLFGESIEDLLEKEARLKGFTDEDLASSFTRLVSATKNSQEAFKDLGLAEDVARARHIDLANAALAISKAEQGSATALQRLGIVVPAVTKSVDALKTAHENAVVAGAKFTEAQKQEYTQALANAAAADKQATRVQDLAVIQQRFGGDAASFADTTAGGFARLQAEFHQFEVSLGTNILPLLLEGAQDAVDFVKALDNPAVIGTVGTFVALKTALEAVSLAQKAYQAILVAGGAAAAADTSAQGRYTAAILANTEALNANAIAAGRSAEANAAVVGAEGVGEGEGLLAGLTALATGPTAIVAGIAAVAGGLAYLATRAGAATQATHGLETAVQQLGTAIGATPQDRATVAQDRLTLAQDQAALSASKLGHNTLAYKQLQETVTQDTINLDGALRTLHSNLDDVATGYQNATTKALALSKAEEASERQRRTPAGVDYNSPLSAQQQLNAEAVADYAKHIQDLINKEGTLNPLLTHNFLLLGQYDEVLGKVPDSKTTKLIIDNKNAKLSIEELLDSLGGGLAESANFALAETFQNEINNLANLSGDAEDQGKTIGNAFVAGVEDALHSLDPIVNAAKAQIAANAQLAQTTDPIKQQIASDQTDLASLQQQANDAAVQGAQDLANAIQSAKTNLDSIGQSIADSLSTYIDKPLTDAAARIQAAQAKLSLLGDQQSLKSLGEEVILPGNRQLSADPQKAVAQLEALQKQKGNDPALAQFILQYRSLALQVEGDKNSIQQNAAGLITTAAKTRIANLTDLFNTGKISAGTLEKDITAVLEKNGLTSKTAKSQGASFADTLAGELTGVSQQATALQGFGNNSGLIPSITRPIDTLNATQKTLAGIASSERAKQLSESKAQTKLLKDISAAQAADTFTSSLNHNPGGKTRTQRALVTGHP